MKLTKAEIKELKQKNKEHFNKVMKQLFDMIPKKSEGGEEKMETAKEELKKEITEIIIYFNPWLEKNPQWVEKREADLNNALNKYDIKRKA